MVELLIFLALIPVIGLFILLGVTAGIERLSIGSRFKKLKYVLLFAILELGALCLIGAGFVARAWGNNELLGPRLTAMLLGILGGIYAVYLLVRFIGWRLKRTEAPKTP